MSEMDTGAYLDRIGYHGPRGPTIQVLRSLHRQHLLTVPFENLDIHVGRKITLDQARFYEKIVTNHRGGYCYELNGLFAWLLKQLGYKVTMLSARVVSNNQYSPDFDHMLLLVQLNEPWLADVGFGDSFTRPKQLNNPKPQKDDGHLYQIKNKRILSRWSQNNGQWEPQYKFTLQPRKLRDYSARNRYQQTSPRSHFTQGQLISKLTRTGRITLTDKKLIITTSKRRIEHSLKSKGEFDRLLARHFQLSLA